MAADSVLNVIYLGLEPFDESYLWLTTESISKLIFQAWFLIDRDRYFA